MTYEKITDLELTEELLETKLIESIKFNPELKQDLLKLNGVHNETPVISFSITFDQYTDKIKKEDIEYLIDELEKCSIESYDITCIVNVLYLEGNKQKIIQSIKEYHLQRLQQQQQEQGVDIKEEIQKGIYDIWGTQNPILTKRNSKSKNNKDENEKTKKKEKTAYPINKYSQGIPLVEAILIDNVPYFLALNEDEKDKNPVLYEKIPLTEDMDIVPPERTEYLSKEYSFKSKEEVHNYLDLARHETLDSLFYQVKTILGKYIDMDDDFINILAADVVFTYFQDKLGMTHYLLIVGDNNTGKSNILLVFSILGYRAVLDTSITPANIYNFGSQLEETQHTIIEDELGNIDEQFDKKRMYQVSYRSGTNVTRMYDNPIAGNTARKSSRQQRFFLYCFKMFATEEMPDKVKSKGFIERLIPLKALPGNPKYDIAEILDDSGDEEFKKLNQELMDTRKLLLMYRLLHHKDPIPNVELNIKNRYKQLTKSLIRLFQNTQSLEEIIKSLSEYVIEKNEEKIDSLDSELLYFIIDLVNFVNTKSKRDDGTTKLFNKEIWDILQEKYPDGKVKDKDGKENPYSWYIEGCWIISKKRLTEICETKFGAIKYRDRALGRALIFDIKTLNRIEQNYSIIKGIQIVDKEDENGENQE